MKKIKAINNQNRIGNKSLTICEVTIYGRDSFDAMPMPTDGQRTGN